ncbi:PREDICTED: zinc finger CCCH domain-containing protein 22 [Camelina sativa]|uniref:Zinc finger CCCH domain-containing protein 22 n=1 Tax=Camelina sativa TaxID=90675 RepID=A0ABM0WKS5_CAMSA|nr:PREDICTED: zinc finger CCCH domain-containing protein 22 [Camelina sativa]
MASEEDKALEDLLDVQLNEQKESLSAIGEALASDPFNPELLSVHEELLQAIKETEEGLFHLKRARLLQEADIVLNGLSRDAGEHLNELEPEKKDLDGSQCRFRHTDGRWYNGRIIGFEGSDTAKISFLTPTSESMTMCKFFMQQRCRFGSSCRSSHGLDVPLSSLKNYAQTEWKESMVGSKIWAVSGGKDDIWRKAELESWDDELQVGGIVFRDDGSSAKLGSDAMALSEYAQMTDDDGEEEEENEEGSGDSDSGESISSDYDEESPQGIGFLESTNQPRGVQTDTALFAKWENHTRGIASKMMASMGYREGMGLGASGQGILNPVLVKVLPAKRSLDYALEHVKNGEGKSEKQKKKRSRGGKRKREKKFAEAARAAKQKEESKPDLFSFINEQIFPRSHEKVSRMESVKKKQNSGPVDRKALVAYQDEIKDLKVELMKLEQMVNRNKKDQVVSDAATKRLNQVRKALASTLASQAAASNAVEIKEKEKKWLKF